MSKQVRMKKLVEERKAAQWPGYTRIGDYHGGVYECDHVSPLSIAAGNLDAAVMVMAQDWDSHEGLARTPEQPGRGYNPDLPTNRALDELLEKHFSLQRKDLFATNLFPFVKPGGMSARISTKDLVRAAKEFGLPQVDIVQPKLVICLGLATFNALRRAAELEPVKRLNDAIGSPFSYKGTQVWCQSHPGALGRNNRNRGGVDRVSQDWGRMAKAFASG